MKRIFLFSIIVIMLFSCIPSFAKPKNVGLSIDGEPVYCSAPPMIIEGRTLIPSSVLVSVLDISVRWNNALNRLTITFEDTTMEMRIGSTEAKVNGKKLSMETAPMLHNGSKMIPLRFFATHLGYDVAWEDETKTVLLTKKPDKPQEEEKPQKPQTQPDKEDVKKEETDTTDKSPVVLPTMDHSVIYDVTATDGKEEAYVYLELSKPIAPQISVLSDPHRLVFDFDKTVLKKSGKISDLSLVSEVRYSNQTKSSARVVIETEAPVQYVSYYENGKYCICLYDSDNAMNFFDGILAFPEDTQIKLSKNIASGATFTVSPAIEEQTLPMQAMGISGVSVKNKGKTSTVSVMYSVPQHVTVKDHHILFEHASFAEIREDFDIQDDVTIVLDAGHGGTDPGAIGYRADGSIGVKESVANLYITLRVAALLEDCGIDVRLTRSDDIFVDLYDRAEFANDIDADYFVSIHNNASDADKTVEGTMVMYMTSSVRGAKLAKTVLSAVIDETDQKNLGMRSGDKLVVIRATAMPAILVEGGFLTTPEEQARLADSAFLDTLAAGIARGILENTESEK